MKIKMAWKRNLKRIAAALLVAAVMAACPTAPAGASKYGAQSVLLASQTVTGAGNSATLVVPNGVETLAVYFKVTAFTGTSITFSVNQVDPVSGTVLGTSIISTAAISATGETLVQISPYMAASANKVAQNVVPVEIQIAWTGTITSVTFAVNAEY